MSVFSIFARIYGLRFIISNLQSLPITKYSFFVETIIRNRNHEAKAEILGTVIYKSPKWLPELFHSDMQMPLLWLRDLYFPSHFLGWTWDLFLSIECNETDTELVLCLALKRPGNFSSWNPEVPGKKVWLLPCRNQAERNEHCPGGPKLFQA